jgi:hypothetical protein
MYPMARKDSLDNNDYYLIFQRQLANENSQWAMRKMGSKILQHAQYPAKQAKNSIANRM